MIFSRLNASVGMLRIVLGLCVLVLIGFAPFSGGPVHYDFPQIVPSLLVPTLVPMLFFVILLDMLMTRVFMIETSAATRRRFKNILWLECGLLVVLTAAWWPFFSRLLVR